MNKLLKLYFWGEYEEKWSGELEFCTVENKKKFASANRVPLSLPHHRPLMQALVNDTNSATTLVSPVSDDKVIMIDWEKELDLAYQELHAAEAEASFFNHPEEWLILDEC